MNKPPAPEPLPSTVEIWLETVARPDRSVWSWCYLANRSHLTRAICVTLNLEHPLVRRALAGRDETLIALLLAISLAEYLLYRRRGANAKWLKATLDQLLASLFPNQPEVRQIAGAQFLANTLAASPPFKAITRSPFTAALTQPDQKTLVATVALQTTTNCSKS